MKYPIIKRALLVLTILLAGCHSHDHGPDGHAHDDHDHGDHGDHDGHGDHDEDEVPAVVVTQWGEEVELFVEFPVFVVGEESKFAAHFTYLDGHQPVTEGQLTIRLGSEEVKAKAPARAGIYTPIIIPRNAGIYTLEFELRTGETNSVFRVDSVRVYGNIQEAQASNAEADDDGAISFLKEQAWKMEFQTEPVQKGSAYNVVSTSGIWKSSTAGTRSVVAPVGGIAEFGTSELVVGGRVRKGQLLFSISSAGLTNENLGANVEQARSVFKQAEAEFERKTALYDSRIISRSELEQVESRYEVAKANYENLVQGYASGVKRVYAPFTGSISSVGIANGSYASEGRTLITLASESSRLLEVHVPVDIAIQSDDILDVYYRPTSDTWSSIQKAGGQVVSVSNEVSPSQPMRNILVKVNESVEAPLGGYSEVQVAYDESPDRLLVPESALMEDYGKFSVIVQLSGESFERRDVQIGRRNGESVEIVSGLDAGEWVVTKGVYQVRMASMSGQLPAHGHSH